MTVLALGAALAGIVGTWAVLYVAVAGLGLAALHLTLGARPATVRDAPWVGLGTALLVLQLWHLVLPITALTTVLVIGGGWVAAVRYRRAWSPPRWTPAAAAAATSVVAWVALRAMGEMTLFDSGMYHVPFVSWAKEYPIVPGLGNLHGRLGFNPASLLLAALCDVGPWSEGSQHIVNGFLVAAFAVPAIRGAVDLRAGSRARPRAVFDLAVLPAVLAAAMRQDIRSLSTDLPAFVLLSVAGGMLFELLIDPDESAASSRLAALLTVLAAAVCVKLSAAPFAAGAAAAALWFERRTVPRRRLLRTLAIPSLLVLAWLTRGGVLTGYPLYPSRLIALPVDWRVSAEQADAESAWITMSARILNTNSLHTSGTWVREWGTQVLTRGDLFAQVLAPLLLCLACAVFAVMRRRSAAVPWRRLRWMLAPVAAALAVWWWTAPHPRMAQAPFWVLAAASVWLALGSDPVLTPARRRLLLAVSSTCFLVLAGRIALGEMNRASPSERLSALIGATLAEPTSGRWLAPMPEADLLDYRSPTGMELAVPRVDNSCWNGPLLCTPHPTPHLALRSPGDPGGGFRQDGAWTPAWFPNPWIPFLAYWRCLRSTGRAGTAAAIEGACQRAAESREPPSAGPR